MNKPGHARRKTRDCSTDAETGSANITSVPCPNCDRTSCPNQPYQSYQPHPADTSPTCNRSVMSWSSSLTDGRTDGRTDDGRTDGRTDGRMDKINAIRV